MFLLDVLYLLVILPLSPLWLLMFAIKPALRAGLAARFCPPSVSTSMQDTIWLHGSSAGEIALLRPLVIKISEQANGCNIVISAFSISGFSAARKAFPNHCVFFFPADFSPVIRKFIKVLRPVLIVLVESEFWPNFIATVTKSGIPVCVLNARMSEKSFLAHRRTRLIPWALKKISFFAAQTTEDATRLHELGVGKNRISVTGNMKYDLQDGSDPDDRKRMRHKLRTQYALDDKMPVLVGGSIHRGEDLALAWAYSEMVKDGLQLRMIVVPRYPAESPMVCHALEKHGLIPLQKQVLSGREKDTFIDPRHVLVIDTLGELKQFYAMADIAFVGGSLLFRGSNKGGHNLMEPAILGVAVMFGPHNYSFRDTVKDLLENRAGLLVQDREEIVANLKGLLGQPTVTRDMGREAREVIMSNRGATDKNFALLNKYPPFVRN